MTTNRAVAIVAWLVAIAIAATLDRSTAYFMYDHGVDAWLRSHALVRESLKSPGTYVFTATLALILAFVHPLRWRAAGFMLLATAITGVNGLVKWMVGRTRPFKWGHFDATSRIPAFPFTLAPFRGGLPGLFQSTNLCFPSGHATLAFATAAAMTILWPRTNGRWWYVLAALVAAERVAENAHWLSDVVAGAALGIGGVHVMHWIVRKLLPPPSEPRGFEVIVNE